MKTLLKVFLFIMLLSAFNITQAQTYEEWQKQEQSNFDKFKAEEQKMLQKMRDDYSIYVKKHDKEFSDFLKKEWGNFQVSAGKTPPEKPKPQSIPAYTPLPGAPVPFIPIITSPAIPIKIPTLVKRPVLQKPEPVDFPTDAFSINYCGVKVYLDIDQDIKNLATSQKGKQAITDFWDNASKTNYNSLLDQLKEAKSKFNVNDYGYFMLIQETAKSIYPMPEQQDYRNLLAWFLMVRSGYDVRIAYNENQIALLLPSYNTLYSKQFLTIDNVQFYFIDSFEGSNIRTYDKSYDLANTLVDFNISNPMNFGISSIKKVFPFKYLGKTYNFEFAYDPGVMLFYKNYPQLDMELYFNAAVSLDTKESIDFNFKPVLSDLSESDAVNLLLNFVQTAFAYKTDQEQFDREKFFFAEELFYYPASDCEDRSALFAYLVRDLLGLKVVGLHSPNHMFTAVHFNAKTAGDYVTYKGEQYIVADPTYINAPFGRTMPVVSLQETKIIAMNNVGQKSLEREKAWDIAMKSGIKKASTAQTLVFDKSGNFYVTGYFTGPIAMGSFTAEGTADIQSFITAKFDNQGKLLWADNQKCSGNAAGLAVAQDPDGNLYVAGSFNGTFGQMKTGKSSDIFLAKYSSSGDKIWKSSAGMDTIPKGAGLIYSLEFDKKGKKEDVRISEFSPTYSAFGLFVSETTVIFNGAMQNTMVPMNTTMAVNAVAEMNYPELLKKEFDQFVAKKTDRSAAGIFAFSNIIKKPGVIIAGKDIQKTFEKYNPTFKTKCPNIYKNIGKVTIVKNSNNIITILTEDGSDVLFDKLKIKNNSQIRISMLPDGNIQLDAVSGVKVGKMVVWYPLNFIRVLSKTGDLLFDYDDDHTQTLMNLKKDILN
jgi:hypothetical protein